MFLIPDWSLPPGVKALITTREGGVSDAPFASFNLAQHVGDLNENVNENRGRLLKHIAPVQVQWLTQVHGKAVHEIKVWQAATPEADAAFTSKSALACAVLTADCLPVLLCADDGLEVAAAHAGWRGLAKGILQQTVKAFSAPASSLSAYLGPAISQARFEVGTEVREIFATNEAFLKFGVLPQGIFEPSVNAGKYQADLYALARLALQSVGVNRICGGQFCSANDERRFYSYRRDGKTGRMASLIWKD